MQHVIVRTKLQASIVERLVEDQVVRPPFHLIQASHASEPDPTPHLGKLLRLAGRVTLIRRPRHGFVRVFLYFLGLLIRSRIDGSDVFLANVNWYHFGLALRLVPGKRIRTFDDGSANVQPRSAFYTDDVVDLSSIRGYVARRLFPGGVARFTRSRIETHYSIYPGMENIVDAGRIVPVRIDWKSMLSAEDVARLPRQVSRILIGTVYQEALKIWGIDVDDARIAKAIAWADLYLPHPRQPGSHALDE